MKIDVDATTLRMGALIDARRELLEDRAIGRELSSRDGGYFLDDIILDGDRVRLVYEMHLTTLQASAIVDQCGVDDTWNDHDFSDLASFEVARREALRCPDLLAFDPCDEDNDLAIALAKRGFSETLPIVASVVLPVGPMVEKFRKAQDPVAWARDVEDAARRHFGQVGPSKIKSAFDSLPFAKDRVEVLDYYSFWDGENLDVDVAYDVRLTDERLRTVFQNYDFFGSESPSDLRGLANATRWWFSNLEAELEASVRSDHTLIQRLVRDLPDHIRTTEYDLSFNYAGTAESIYDYLSRRVEAVRRARGR